MPGAKPHDPRPAEGAAAALICEGQSCDFQTLNEGLAYAMSPGIHHTGNSDPLQASVAGFMAKGSPLSESYTRFNTFALALRPLLMQALADPKQNLDSFLPRAADAWLVLTELDHARGKAKE